MFPVFMAGSMGMAVNNTKAIFEAIVGKKTEFVRTPKTGDISNAEKFNSKKYKQRKVSGMVIIEILLALYFIFGIAISIKFLELAAIPFQVMFLAGFGTIGYLSLKHALKTK